MHSILDVGGSLFVFHFKILLMTIEYCYNLRIQTFTIYLYIYNRLWISSRRSTSAASAQIRVPYSRHLSSLIKTVCIILIPYGLFFYVLVNLGFSPSLASCRKHWKASPLNLNSAFVHLSLITAAIMTMIVSPLPVTELDINGINTDAQYEPFNPSFPAKSLL